MPEAPRAPVLALDHLEPGTADDLREDRAHDGVRFADADLTGARLHDRDLVECELDGARLDDAVLRGSRLRETRLIRCEATALAMGGCQLREVEIDGSGWVPSTSTTPTCASCGSRAAAWATSTCVAAS